MNFPYSWSMLRIDQIKANHPGSVAIGPFGSRMKSDLYAKSGVPVIRGQNITDSRQFGGEFVYISDETADKLSSCLVYADDLVFPHRGAIGLVAIVPRDQASRYMMSTSLMKLTCDKDKVDPRFIFYFFRSRRGRDELLKRSSTVGTPGIGQPLASLRSIEVPVPPIAEQRAIANLLGALDSKIAVNDRMAETVFEIAEARYRQIIGAASSVWPLKDILELRYGKALPAATRSTGPVPVYGSGGLAGWHNEAIAPGPGIIVGRKGSVGTVYWSAREFFAIDTTFYVALKRDIPLEFVFFMLRSLGLGTMNSDSAVPGLNRNDALSLSVRVPAESDLRKFHSSVGSIFELRHALTSESAALARLRDALLPRLMSGEVRVRDAERVTEDRT